MNDHTNLDFLRTPHSQQRVIYFHDKMPAFEQMYLPVRQAENRLYSDQVVLNLPDLPPDHIHAKEWKIRKNSVSKLLTYLETFHNPGMIMDLGCGNGWFTNQLAKRSLTLGMDINEIELLQASRLFSGHGCHFAYGDIFRVELPEDSFDFIILNNVIQYFISLTSLLNRLMPMLNSFGEIHILDSPIYATIYEAGQARKRSAIYFQKLGFPSAAAYYHHHILESLAPYNPQFLYDPGRIFSRIKRKVLGQGSLFPWIKIMKQDVWS